VGAAASLTYVLSRTDDEAFLDSLAAALAGVSGPLSCGTRVRSVEISGGDDCAPTTVHVVESGLSDGLGARLWTASYMLCRELLSHRWLVDGAGDVLELGSGCGLCGLYAAHLGANQVTMTDCIQPLLNNLIRSAATNFPAAIMTKVPSSSPPRTPPTSSSWDMGPIRVRHLDWAMEGGGGNETRSASVAPTISGTSQFHTIIASDVIYDAETADHLPNCLARRLAPHGRVLLVQPIRQREIFHRFADNLKRVGLRIDVRKLQPQDSDEGIHDKDEMHRGVGPYEGGYVSIRIEWLNYPASDWGHTIDWTVCSGIA